MALARCAREAVRRSGCAVDAIRPGDGGLLHAQPHKDHGRLERARGLLMAGTTKRVGMPQLGESVHEGTISKWLVKPGDKVVEFEPMLEVDTDKVSAEVPAPVTGILKEILAKEGETVQAGAEIAVVEVGGDSAAPLPAPEADGNAAAPAAEPKAAAPKKAATAAATPEAPA